MSEHCPGCDNMREPGSNYPSCPGIACPTCAEKDMRHLDDCVKLGACEGQLDVAWKEIARLTQHDPGCPAIADDESDEVLHDYQQCLCIGPLRAEIARLRALVDVGREIMLLAYGGVEINLHDETVPCELCAAVKKWRSLEGKG